ncbi:MAG: RIP metalloprotease RseP [Alphaproteobacteria bacterium]|nr:RIP metalloprotease RseP [Alphaproteobacteria bacterium]
MNFLISTLSFIVLLAILVGFHEYGHLLIARSNGVFCEAFSLGMGKVLWEKSDKYGTKWRISLLPIGGYVKMFGDADATSVKECIPEGYTEEDMQKMSAFRKAPWQRLLIALGGPLANFVLAIVVFFGINAIKGVPEPDTVISVVSQESVAYRSGLRDGDKIVSINNNKINNFIELSNQIKENVGKDISIEVSRNNTTEQFNAKLYKEENGEKKAIQQLGITTTSFKYNKTGILNAFTNACKLTYNIGAQNIKAIFKVFTSGKKELGNVGGIISMFKAASTSAERGIVDFLSMLAMLSVVLGAINLLPIPVLDGGTVLISAIEWIIGKRLSEKVIEVIFTIGLVIVVGLMVIGLWNDIAHTGLFAKIASLFK